MAIVNMKKMHLLGLKKEQETLLRALQKSSSVEIIDYLANDEEEEDQEQEEKAKEQYTPSSELQALNEVLEKLNDGIEIILPYTEERNILKEGRPKVSKSDLENTLQAEDAILEDLEELFEFKSRLSILRTEETQTTHNLDFLKPWEKLDIPLEKLGSVGSTYIYPCIMPQRISREFIDTVEERELLAEVRLVGEKQDEAYILVIYHEKEQQEIENLFREYSVSIQELSNNEGTIKDLMKRCQGELKRVNDERTEILDKIKTYAGRHLDFKILYDYYIVQKERMEAIEKLGGTQNTFTLEAWVPENKIDEINKTLSNITDSVYVVFDEPEEDEDIPVLLDNPKLVKPFEIITELFSLPDPKGLDPNVYMAPFYFVFFGMMLSDAGYGIVLSLLTGYALWKFHLAGEGKKFTQLFFLCGFSTFAWGVIFGGWFGDILPIKPLWINPLDDPVAVLIVSFILGIIQIYTGIALNAYKNIRAGHVADAFMDQGLWIVFLTGLLMFAFPQLSSVAKYVSIFGAVGLIFTQGRDKKNIFARLISGVLSLYDVTGYLSDILSYSRLLALGLTTGVVATVINTMAKTLSGSVIGFIFMILIMIVGHVFNLVINVLGAYVHSSRLQYVEFFGKFYDSGGKAFNPLKAETVYVELEEIL